jgi:hypothetical protein
MPPAVLGPVLGAVIAGGAGAVDANAQNKDAIKNSQNAAAAAQVQTQQNQANALGNLTNFNKANPGPVGGSMGTPSYGGSSIPLAGAGGVVGGQAPQNSQLLQILANALKQGGGQTA